MRGNRGKNFGRFGQAAFAFFVAGHRAAAGTDEFDAAFFRIAIFACVAACAHIIGFIAGAIITGLSVASRTVEARSSARPCAIFAMRLAEAGRNHDTIGLARKPDMAHLLLIGKRPKIGINLFFRQR